MRDGSPKPIYDWGSPPPSAPSTKRVDVLGWIFASVLLGLLAAWLATLLVWRALPGLEAPAGSFAFHVGALIRCLGHALWEPAFPRERIVYGAYLAALSDHERVALIWRACVGIWAALLPAVFLAKSSLTPRDGLIVLRGGARHEGDEAVRILNANLAARVKRRPDHAIAPGILYPADMWTRHVLLVGGVGSGKSTALKPLIEKVIAAKESLLLFDPKGEFTKGFGEPGLVAPWDARSLSWDVARDMRNIGDMRRFASAMIREAQDPMWSNAARQLLVGFMIYLKSTRGTEWGWRELAEMMATPQANILPMMSRYHPEAVRSVERASVTTQGILINLSSFSASIFDLAEAWGETPPDRRVSFVEWAQGQGRHRQLILQGHGAYPDLTKGYLEGVIGTVSAIVNSVEMDDDPNRKLWLIADESGMMGKVPIRPLLDVGRSRGFRCVLACQDLAQLEEIHGAHMVKAMVSMSGTILVGQLMQGDTAEQMCKALGTKEVERVNVSSSFNGGGGGRSSTLSFSRDELAIYKPSELASRLGLTEDGAGVRLALFTAGQAYELFWPHYAMKSARAAHVPAAWTQGLGRMGAMSHPSDGVVLSAGREFNQPSEPEAEASSGLRRPNVIPDASPPAGVDIETGEVLSTFDVSGVGADGATTAPQERRPSFCAGQNPPDIEEIRDMLRTSLEIRSINAVDPALPMESRNDGSSRAETGPEAAAELWTEAAVHSVGGEAASLLIQCVEAADILAAPPGPSESVIVGQAVMKNASDRTASGTRTARDPRRTNR